MKIRVFLIVCAGAFLMLILSSAIVFTQMRSIRAVDLAPLTENLYQEDAKILSWILSAVPLDKIDTLKLPESWAEIFLVNTSDLQLAASTNAAHRGMPLYRHPLLLDQAIAITDAIKANKPSMVSTPSYMVILEPAGPGQMLTALKPKAWEKGLVAQQQQEIESRTAKIAIVLGVFLSVGLFIILTVSFVVTRAVVNPTREMIDALEALSLGNFDYDLKEPLGSTMLTFTESYLRLKTSLEMALEMITRR
jgi:methyl-accepting chemotaxis protein